jgi:hypothetical protein
MDNRGLNCKKLFNQSEGRQAERGGMHRGSGLRGGRMRHDNQINIAHFDERMPRTMDVFVPNSDGFR